MYLIARLVECLTSVQKMSMGGVEDVLCVSVWVFASLMWIWLSHGRLTNKRELLATTGEPSSVTSR